VAGTFFPLEGLPEWAQTLGQLNPLYHCVELVRHAVFGLEGWTDVGHVAVLALFGMIMWRLAIWRMEKRLIS
jgi:lipooligosaccharide transport system permease protein